MKKREKLVLIELLKNGRQSDKNIAKTLGTSQPTITRIRQRLEKRGLIRSYRPHVDLQKIGLNIIVLTVFKIKDFALWDKLKKKVLPSILDIPQIISIGLGEGFGGKNGMFISVHKNFEEYQSMILQLREKYGKYVTDIDQFVMSIDRVYRVFSMYREIIDILSKE